MGRTTPSWLSASVRLESSTACMKARVMGIRRSRADLIVPLLIELLDQIGVLIHDRFPPHLERRRDLFVLHREVAVEHMPLLDLLDAREVRVDVLYRVRDQLLHIGVSDEIGEV